MKLGENIKFQRKNAKLTQKQLAEKIGVTTITIQNYENNRREPNIETLNKIAEALGVNISMLIDVSDTLTSKLVKFLDEEVFKESTFENTIELISELVDVDFNLILEAINNNEDISESYLCRMLNLICKTNKNLFLEFYRNNQNIIREKYLICDETCQNIIESILNNSLLESSNNIYDDALSAWSNEIKCIEDDPRYLLNSLLHYLSNKENYKSNLYVKLPIENIIRDKNNGIPLEDEEINKIIQSTLEFLKFQLYQIANERKTNNTYSYKETNRIV